MRRWQARYVPAFARKGKRCNRGRPCLASWLQHNHSQRSEMSTDLSIGYLSKAYAVKELSPRKLIESLRQRRTAVDNPSIWIYQLNEGELEPYLRRLEESDPSALPLYGIPFAIKDNIDLAGVPTTAACAAYSYTPDVSAPVVEKLMQAGAIDG